MFVSRAPSSGQHPSCIRSIKNRELNGLKRMSELTPGSVLIPDFDHSGSFTHILYYTPEWRWVCISGSLAQWGSRTRSVYAIYDLRWPTAP